MRHIQILLISGLSLFVLNFSYSQEKENDSYPKDEWIEVLAYQLDWNKVSKDGFLLHLTHDRKAQIKTEDKEELIFLYKVLISEKKIFFLETKGGVKHLKSGLSVIGS